MLVNNADDIFTKCSKESFREMLTVASKFTDIDIDKLIKDYYGDNLQLDVLYKLWEQSVKKNEPNYELYNAEAYMTEVFNCWRLYSRRYLLLLKKYLVKPDCKIDVSNINTVLDLGCGNGYTTVGLSSLFPNAQVYGTNLSGTLQFEIDKCVTDNIENCHIIDESRNADIKADLIFASEFFEHLTEPLRLLRQLLKNKPKYIIFANTFTKMSLGHFVKYNDNGVEYSGKDMSRLFSKTLRQSGYKKVQTGFFNNRPNVYMLDDRQHKLF